MALRVDTDSTDWVEITELLTSAYQRVAPRPAAARPTDIDKTPTIRS
jgi:hypothetical protein